MGDQASPSGKKMTAAIFKCLEDPLPHKADYVAKCATDDQITEFIENLMIFTMSFNDYIDFDIREQGKVPVYERYS